MPTIFRGELIAPKLAVGRELGNGITRRQGAPGPWDRSIGARVMSIQITSANLAANTVAVAVSGPAGTSGTLDVIANGVNNHPQVTASGGALGPGQYTVAFNRPSMPADTYTTLTTRWNTGASPVSTTYTLPNVWLVLGMIRHSQYNTPSESACTGASQTAWTFNNSCTFTQVTLRTDFVSQTYINGTGKSVSHGVIKYTTGRYAAATTRRERRRKTRSWRFPA